MGKYLLLFFFLPQQEGHSWRLNVYRTGGLINIVRHLVKSPTPPTALA